MENAIIEKAKQLTLDFNLPELSDEVMQLQQELKKEMVNTHKVVDIIEKNPIMAGELLSEVNSVAKYRRTPVTSVNDAVKLIGLKRVYNLLVSSALKKLFQSDILYQDEMNFSVDVAFCMADLADYVDSISREEAYMLGLFHHIGVMVLISYDPEGYKKMYIDSLISPISIIEIEERRYGTNHKVIGALMVKKWSLPKEFLNAILLHHTYPCGKIQDNKVRTLVAMIQLASMMMTEISVGDDSSQELREMKQSSMEELMISEDVVQEIQKTLVPYAVKCG